jgi:hypothetical protein
MSGGDEPVKINPAEVEHTAQGVAGTLAQAAQPGPVPTATGTSPIDGAALAASATVISFVASASADLTPRGAEVVGAADTALAGFQAADTENTTELEGVGQQALAQAPPVRPGAAAAPAGIAQSASQVASGGLGEIQQAVSGVASAISAPASSLSGISPGSALSGAPLSSLTGAHVPPRETAMSPENTGDGPNADAPAVTSKHAATDLATKKI